MSLIVARKIQGNILILSDTKLSYPKEAQFNKHNSHPSDSTIKALVVDPSLVICFAGEKYFAEQAVSHLYVNLSLADLRELMLAKHLESNSQTEFLVVTAEPLTMYEFKGGTVHEVDQSWIGSSAAFEQYQGYNLGVLTPKNTGSVSVSMEMQSDEKQPAAFQGMSTAFDSVIDDGEIAEVDGFKVKIGIQNGRFKYLPYMHSYRSSRWKLKSPTNRVFTTTMSVTHLLPSEVIPLTFSIPVRIS